MPNKSLYRYTVKGRGQFPIDMLRYDAAHPYSETDSGRLAATFERGAYNIEQHIVLKGRHEPTEERWKSFGWTVIYPVEKVTS